MPEAYDVVTLGGGPGGYVAAVRSASLGLKTAVVEQSVLGGVCLNLGCIPSKAMLHAASLHREATAAAAFGITAKPTGIDYASLLNGRRAAVEQLRKGVASLLHSDGVAVIEGRGHLLDSHTLEVESDLDRQVIEFRHLILATGSRAVLPPIPGANRPGVIDSDGALDLAVPPRRAVIIGGGAIGAEWVDIWHSLGAEVIVLELLPQILPAEEPEIARELVRAWGRRGVTTHTSARVQAINAVDAGLEVVAAINDTETTFPADVVLVATGRVANVDGLNLEAAGIRYDRTGIATDAQMHTNVRHVFAVGDVTGRSLLAHVASHQGIVAAETIAGRVAAFDDHAIPSVVFTDPEIAHVGLGEGAAKERGIPLAVGRFPFAALGRAVASGQTAGLVKILAHAETGEVVGVHVAGPRAGELISEASQAMHLHATLRDVAHTIHPHPTFSEALMEAAWAALGDPLHIPRRPARPATAR